MWYKKIQIKIRLPQEDNNLVIPFIVSDIKSAKWLHCVVWAVAQILNKINLQYLLVRCRIIKYVVVSIFTLEKFAIVLWIYYDMKSKAGYLYDTHIVCDDQKLRNYLLLHQDLHFVNTVLQYFIRSILFYMIYIYTSLPHYTP